MEHPTQWDKIVAEMPNFYRQPSMMDYIHKLEEWGKKLIKFGNERERKAQFYDMMKKENMIVALPYTIDKGYAIETMILNVENIMEWKRAYDDSTAILDF